ncbi:MAG: methylated-DNA--[protein]-cysteine S-methyltransferase [Pseudomonadota bacterium]
MKDRFDAVVPTPIGRVGVVAHHGGISGVVIGVPPTPGTAGSAGRAGAAALAAYFEDPQLLPDVELSLGGTEFQQRVWRALRAIPVGSTRTYGELAEILDTSPRAVGNACRANPCPIFVPCHRVVAAQGPGGFAGRRQGRWIDIKRWLLRHEGAGP